MSKRTVNDNLDGGMIMILSWIIINFFEFSKQINPPTISKVTLFREKVAKIVSTLFGQQFSGYFRVELDCLGCQTVLESINVVDLITNVLLSILPNDACPWSITKKRSTRWRQT